MRICYRDMPRNSITGNNTDRMDYKPDDRQRQDDPGCYFGTFKQLCDACNHCCKITRKREFEKNKPHQKQPSSQRVIFMCISSAALPTSL